MLTKRPERMLEWFNLKRDTGMWKRSTATTAWHVWRKVSDIQNSVRRETCCPFMWNQQAPDADAILGWPLPNVWLGVSVEDQKTADERIPLLLQTPAAVRFISAEPLLGAVNLRVREEDPDQQGLGWNSDALMDKDIWHSDDGVTSDGPSHPALDWVICGGESGPGARPMHPDWARSLRDQCVAAGVPFFFKQWGEWICPTQFGSGAFDPRVRGVICRDGRFLRGCDFGYEEGSKITCRIGKKAAGSLLDGVEWKQFPEARSR